MKIRSLLCGLFAMAAISACEQKEPVVTPSLDVNKTSAAVPAEGGEVTVEVTSNVEWTAKADQDWVTVSPANGNGSEKAVAVKLNVEPNEAEEARTATVTVSAEKLSKTVKVTQAGMEAPEPVTYILVGEAVGGWDPTNNGVVMVLKDGYYSAKAVSVTAKKGMHFTKNAAWEGNVKGKHGLIAPNEIGEVGSNDISLTEGGKFDVYLTEALDKFYFMSEGKLPSEAVEHKDIAVSWGICGAYGNNNWGSGDPDVELVQDGEWYVAKNIEFTEVNFKVRGNNSWADDVKWGRTAEDQVCELNKAIAVSTCTEYKAANEGAGDNPNVYIDAPAGTYDVYFSPDKKEVWVMTPGYKPGETPEPEPAEYEVDGKQWVFTWEPMYGADAILDLGATDPGYFYIVFDQSPFGAAGWGVYYSGTYTVENGVLKLLVVDPVYGTETAADVPYTMASEDAATFDTSAIEAMLMMTSVSAVASPEYIDIFGGGQDVELLADGDYWIVSGGKVATPVASSGALQTVDAVGGRSTAANAFTFRMIDEVEWLYSIKDSNGMYLYLDASGNFGVSATIDYMDDAFCWQIYPMGDGTYYIANYNTMGAIQLDVNNTYVCVEDMVGAYPELILAENPVEDQPEIPSDPAVKETIWNGEPFDLGSDWSKGLQINSVPRLPEDARIHVVYEAPAGYDYYQFKFCYVNQEWNWVSLTSPTGMNADGCVTLDASATEYSFALNAEDIAAINSGRGLVVQGYAAIIKEVYYTSEIEVGDGPKVIWEGRQELLSDWSTKLEIQNMPHLESGMSIYVEYEATGYDYYQFKFCYIDQNWGWNAMTSPVDVNEYGCVMLDPQKTEYVLALNDEDIAAINAGKGMVIQGYGAVITKVSYK